MANFISWRFPYRRNLYQKPKQMKVYLSLPDSYGYIYCITEAPSRLFSAQRLFRGGPDLFYRHFRRINLGIGVKSPSVIDQRD